jgi:hypothetical protein
MLLSGPIEIHRSTVSAGLCPGKGIFASQSVGEAPVRGRGWRND